MMGRAPRPKLPMNLADIPAQRLVHQHILKPSFQKADDVVRWMGALQSQDYAAAKWAVARRAANLTDSAIDRALAEGAILRTHVMRPTWHFVAPEDIRWLLALTAPRVHAANAYYYRQLELNQATIKRSRAVWTKTLSGGNQLTRRELGIALRRAGLEADGLRLAYLIIHAELDGIICSGARRGKQFTYALLDERVPPAGPRPRDEALAELTRRYLTSRGPATEEDLIWWSGLSRADVKRGLELVRRSFEKEEIEGRVYWFSARPLGRKLPRTFVLLPNFDEYVVGYADRSAIFDPSRADQLDARRNPLFQHTIVIDGHVRGTWKRTLKKDRVILELNPFAPLTKIEREAIVVAAGGYADFLEMQAELQI
ncbi:MAG TPA: winged helix DNA-binding domain-containing protein [Anaerolineales bacterium]|nr:winged helix DNA-binding domain-containing protein [Anaerolineales bacterium]